jgi:hypothetical protein
MSVIIALLLLWRAVSRNRGIQCSQQRDFVGRFAGGDCGGAAGVVRLAFIRFS